MQGNQTNIYLHVPSFCRYYVKHNGHSILVMKYLFYPKWKEGQLGQVPFGEFQVHIFLSLSFNLSMFRIHVVIGTYRCFAVSQNLFWRNFLCHLIFRRRSTLTTIDQQILNVFLSKYYYDVLQRYFSSFGVKSHGSLLTISRYIFPHNFFPVLLANGTNQSQS